jgi:hypothetical protein
MVEPTTQRMRVTFTVKRADNGQLFIACDPLEGESEPVVQGSHPTGSEPGPPEPNPTETEAVIRGSETDPTLISGLFTFALKEGVSEEHAIHLAHQMTDMLSHLMYTPL